jgi:ABC-2 type transport system ATP-binding protein
MCHSSAESDRWGVTRRRSINLFLNFVDATAGTASVNGLDVASHPIETKQYLAYIPETVTLTSSRRCWRD